MYNFSIFLILFGFILIDGFGIEIKPKSDFNIICSFSNEAIRINSAPEWIKYSHPDCNFYLYNYNVIDYSSNGTIRFFNTNRKNHELQIIKKFVKNIRLKESFQERKIILISIGDKNLKLEDFIYITSSQLNLTQFAIDVAFLCKDMDLDGVDLRFKLDSIQALTKSKQALLKKFIVGLKYELYAVIWKNKLQSLQISLSVFSSCIESIDKLHLISDFLREFDIINIIPFELDLKTSLKYEQLTTRYNLPLFSNDTRKLSLERVIESIVKLQIPRHKLSIALPFFGITFSLQFYHKNKVNDIAVALGKPGIVTETSGFLSYFEICEILSNKRGLIQFFDDDTIAPVLQYQNQWISYDNQDSIKTKASFIKCKNLKNIMIYSIDYDVINGKCPSLIETVLDQINNQVTSCRFKKKQDEKQKIYYNNIKVPVNQVNLMKKPLEQSEMTIIKKEEARAQFISNDFCQYPTNNNKFALDPKNCEVFYQCSHGKAIKHKCPQRLAFNYENNVCDFKINVKNCL